MKRILIAGLIILVIPSLKVPATSQDRAPSRGELVAVKRIIPAYPEKLQDEGVEGEVVILIQTDVKGNVLLASVIKGLHPELDHLAVEAMKQWKFKPFLVGGEPVKVMTFVSFLFKPKSTGETAAAGRIQNDAAEPEAPLPNELQVILDKGDAYVRKLSSAALFYVCQEKVRERRKNLGKVPWGMTVNALEDAYVMQASYEFPALRGSEKASYLNDYQLISKGGKAEERRILLQEDGRAISGKVSREAKRTYSLRPIYVPIRLLGREERGLFTFRLAGTENVRGKEAFVIEVTAKSRRKAEIRRAKAWIDTTTFQVLKAEVETATLPGDAAIAAECAASHLRPRVIMTHSYGIEKNGLLFPSRSEIRVEYLGLIETTNDVKLEVDIAYDHYRFFTVDTETILEGVKKRTLPPRRLPTPARPEIPIRR